MPLQVSTNYVAQLTAYKSKTHNHDMKQRQLVMVNSARRQREEAGADDGGAAAGGVDDGQAGEVTATATALKIYNLKFKSWRLKYENVYAWLQFKPNPPGEAASSSSARSVAASEVSCACTGTGTAHACLCSCRHACARVASIVHCTNFHTRMAHQHT